MLKTEKILYDLGSTNIRIIDGSPNDENEHPNLTIISFKDSQGVRRIRTVFGIKK